MKIKSKCILLCCIVLIFAVVSILSVCHYMECEPVFITDLKVSDIEAVYASEYWGDINYNNKLSNKDVETIIETLGKIEIRKEPVKDLKMQGGTALMFRVRLKSGQIIDFAANGNWLIINAKEYYFTDNYNGLKAISDIYYKYAL